MTIALSLPLSTAHSNAKGDLNAEHYKENSQLQFSLAQDPLANYDFRGDEIVLDVGCGDGKITAQIAAKVPNGRVIGIDKSSAMIKFAKESFPQDIYPNLEFKIADVQHFNSHERFDLVTSFSCLHWTDNQVLALEQIKQSLKPGGKAIILTFPRCFTFWEPIEFVVDQPRWIKYFTQNSRPYHFLNPNDYVKVADELKLKILHLESSSHVAQFKGKKGFEDYVRGWLPFLIDLPKSMHDEFIEEIGEKSLELVPIDAQGNVNHPYDKILLIFEVY